jgi:hypothetical protein
MTNPDKLRAQLLVDVEYDLNGSDPQALIDSLHGIANFYAKRAKAISDSTAAISSFRHQVVELGLDDEPRKRRPLQISPQGVNQCECDDAWCPGWGIFYRDVDGVYDIQRCDTCKRFASDEDAFNYVRGLEGLDLFRHMMAHKEEFKKILADGRRRSVMPFLEFLDDVEDLMGLYPTKETRNDESTAGR